MYLCISIELHTSFYRVEPTIQAENDFIASSLVPQQLEIESIGRKKKKKNTTQLSQKQRPPIPQNYGYY